MKNRERYLVRLLRRLPPEAKLLARPPVIEPYAQSMACNLLVSAVLLVLSLWLSYSLEAPRSHCVAASTVNPLVGNGALFIGMLVWQSAHAAFRLAGFLRWTRNVPLASAGIFLFAAVRVAICW